MKMRLLGIYLILFILLTGCWDKLEMERRALVLGAGADVASVSQKGAGRATDEAEKLNLYSLTVETVLTKKKSGEKEGGGGDSAQQGGNTIIHTDMGASFFEIIRNRSAESDKLLFFGHQQVLVIGEELARTIGLDKTMDFWGRAPEVDRSIKVFLTPGKAKDVFDADRGSSGSMSMYIKDVAEQHEQALSGIEMNAVTLLSKLAGGGDFLMGALAFSHEDTLRLSKSGVIKGGKLIGWLDEKETRAANLALEEQKSGQIPVKNPEGEGDFVTVEIVKSKPQLKAAITDSSTSFTFNIKLRCNIIEISTPAGEVDEKTISKVEKMVSDTIETQIKELLAKLQKEYKADALGLGQKLKKYHNREWKKIEKEWNTLYPEVPVSVKVDTTVRGIGRKF